MRQTMHHAFSEQLLNLDEQFKAAVEDATQPEKIQELLTDAANRFIKEAVEEETKSYFLYGEGRAAIAEKVKERLSETGVYL